jgi:hypothetical protein
MDSKIEPARFEPIIFQPTETWPNTEHQYIDVAVNDAINDMNKEDPSKLIAGLMAQVKTADNGISYAILKGSDLEARGYSDEEAVVMFNPFAGGATPNMMVRVELIRRIAKKLDVRDAKGKLKPVIMLASPAFGGSSLALSKEELEAIKSGDFGSVAQEYLKVITAKNFGKAALLGFSQGADMALTAANISKSANLDVSRVAIGDPARVMGRSPINLLKDFGQGTNLGEMIDATGMDAQKEALKFGSFDLVKFLASGALIKANRRLWVGLGRDKFEELANELLALPDFEKLVVGYGENSAIAKPEYIEPGLNRLHNEYGRDRLISVKVMEGKHTWGDQLRLLMKLYYRVYF